MDLICLLEKNSKLYAPVLAICRELLRAGCSPDQAIDVYRVGDGRDAAPLVAEVKARQGGAGFMVVEKWLGDYDPLALRRDHAEPIIVLPWRIWARLVAQGQRRDVAPLRSSTLNIGGVTTVPHAGNPYVANLDVPARSPPSKRAMTTTPYPRDRAGVAATAILQIVKTIPAASLQEPIEAYLRDEFAELERQVAAERNSPDA
jgi:hypothetical protein